MPRLQASTIAAPDCPGATRSDKYWCEKCPLLSYETGSFAKTGSGQSSKKTPKNLGDLLHSELCKSSGCPGYPGLGDARAWYEVGTTTTASLMGAQVTKRAFAPFYTKNRTFCQDRPGTNIEKIETKDLCFLAEALRKRHTVARELGAARQGHCVFTIP